MGPSGHTKVLADQRRAGIRFSGPKDKEAAARV
jgi:hypothetical protein